MSTIAPEDRSDEREATYCLVPASGRPGAFVAVFEDGSWAHWTPSNAQLSEVA